MSTAKILIVEDDKTLSNQLAALLTEKGFCTAQCFDGQQGLLTAYGEKFDLILLDVLLPTLDGFSVLSRLRKKQQTPVMMLTACGAEEERIEGYTQGADDYLPKPFNFKELILRIDALLRRSMPDKSPQQPSLTLEQDGLILCRSQQQAIFNDQDLGLTPIQFKLLWTLADHRGEILNKPYLSQVVLERAFSRYDRSLDMHLSRVRRKLLDAGLAPERLSTVHGKGYCLQ